MPKTSIKDIAKLLNVSKTTVSFVINGKGDAEKISKSTQERILTLVEELHYQPNKIAQALKRGKSKTIGYLVPDISDPFYARIARLLEDFFSVEGYQLIMGSTSEDAKKEDKLLRSFMNQQIDGLIAAPTQLDNEIYSSCLKNNLPFVIFDRYVEGVDVNIVASENRKSMRQIVQLLISKGHKNIGLVSLEPIVNTLYERIESYRDTLSLNGIPVDERLIHLVKTRFTSEDILQALESLFGHGCDAIVATNNRVATELIKQINLHYSAKLDVIELGVFDDLDVFDFVSPNIFSVAQPVDSIAEKIVELLLEALRNKKSTKYKCIFEPEIINRTNVNLKVQNHY